MRAWILVATCVWTGIAQAQTKPATKPAASQPIFNIPVPKLPKVLDKAIDKVGDKVADAKRALTPEGQPRVAPWKPKAYPREEVNLILMGDWGNGKKEQKQVAETMAAYVESTGKQFNAALLAGDNFYVQLKSVNDMQWQTLYEDMYDSKRLNFPFYVALGNHDYEGKKAQIEREYANKNPDSRWKFPARWYRIDMPADNPLLSVLMLDSNKPQLTKEEWAEQIRWMDQELGRSHGARWTIACAHHPIFSNGSHGDNGVLMKEWGSVFKKNNLDFYVNGHDHDLQHLQIAGWSTTFMLVGGSGQGTTPMRRDARGPFSRKINGFAHLRVLPDHAEVQYISGIDGHVIHQFERTANGGIEIDYTTGRDRASTKPLKALQGFSENQRGTAGSSTTAPATRPGPTTRPAK